jgi:hypothetical protein
MARVRDARESSAAYVGVTGDDAAMIPTRRPVRLIVGAAWIVVALAFAHLALDSTRPHAIDLHGAMAAITVAAAAMGVVTWLAPSRRPEVLSTLGGAFIVVVSVALILGHAAHETGLLLVASGLLIAMLSSQREQPADQASS